MIIVPEAFVLDRQTGRALGEKFLGKKTDNHCSAVVRVWEQHKCSVHISLHGLYIINNTYHGSVYIHIYIYIYIYLYMYIYIYIYTGLFEMFVEVLTTCHTQYT